MKDLIVAEIESLPPLPQTLMKLQQVCQNSEVTPKEVANIIETDPFLVANIIKFANSPLFGSSKQINSVLQAVLMFGISTTKGLAIASAIKAQFNINLAPYGLKTNDFIEASNAKHFFILQWYNNKPQLDILCPLAFVMHIGMVLIANRFTEVNLIVDKSPANFNFEILKATEKSIAGYHHLEILTLLFEHWNFEKTMVETIRNIENITIPFSLREYVMPLQALNLLIYPYAIATKEQIKIARDFVIKNNLDIQGFDETLLKMNFINELSELSSSNE